MYPTAFMVPDGELSSTAPLTPYSGLLQFFLYIDNIITWQTFPFYRACE